MPQKLVPRIFLVLLITPKQPLHVRKYFERGLLKYCKNLNFIIFELNPFKWIKFLKTKGV